MRFVEEVAGEGPKMPDGSTTVAAGIVTFEADIERFAQNLDSILTQVTEVVVFDNGSSNVDEVRAVCERAGKVTLLESLHNRGIASALNRILIWCRDQGYEWFISLDQDSVVPDGMVLELVRIAALTDASLVSPFIVDRNKMSPQDFGRLQLPPFDQFTQPARRGAITSGALNSVAALLRVGGFDDLFFIDYVDYDLNQRLMDAGFKVVRANRTYLLHEVGRANPTWLRVPRKSMDGQWHLERFYSFGHSEFRCYYKARNRVLFTRKHWRSLGFSHEGIWQLPQQVALTLLFESGRGPKLRAFVRGLISGIRIKKSELKGSRMLDT